MGIIFPRYGSIPDLEDGRSITHREMSKGIELKKPYWFAAHRDVYVARELLKPYMYLEDGKTANKDFKFKSTSVLEDVGVISLYNEVINGNTLAATPREHWVEEFFNGSDIFQIINTQFKVSFIGKDNWLLALVGTIWICLKSKRLCRLPLKVIEQASNLKMR